MSNVYHARDAVVPPCRPCLSHIYLHLYILSTIYVMSVTPVVAAVTVGAAGHWAAAAEQLQ